MLALARRPGSIRVPDLLGILASCALLLAAERAVGTSCEVIEFSAVEQRTQSTIAGEKVSTLVATPAAAPGDFVLLEADFGCLVGDGFDPTPSNNVITVEVQKSVGGAFADPNLATSFESFLVASASVQLFECAGSACAALRFQMPESGFAGPCAERWLGTEA